MMIVIINNIMIIMIIMILLLQLQVICSDSNDNINDDNVFPLYMKDVILELRNGPIIIRKDIAKVAKFMNTSLIPCEKKGRYEMILSSYNDPINDYACSKLPYKSIKSNIIIIERGKCSLHSKAMRVYDSNSLGMIIINDKNDNNIINADFDPSERSLNQIKEENSCYNEYNNDNNGLIYCLNEIKSRYLLQLLVVMIPKSIGIEYKKILNDYTTVIVRVYDTICNNRSIENYFNQSNIAKYNQRTSILSSNTIINDTNIMVNDTNIMIKEKESNYFNELCPILQKSIDKRSLKRLIDRARNDYPNRFNDIDNIDTIIYSDKDKMISLLCIETINNKNDNEYKIEL